MVHGRFFIGSRRLGLFTALVSGTVLFPFSSTLAQSTWTAGSGDFGVGTNWSTNPSPPMAGDTAIINSNAAAAEVTDNRVINQLDLSDGSLKITATGQLTVNSGSIVNGAATLLIDPAGILSANVSLSSATATINNSGTINGTVTATAGTLVNNSGATISAVANAAATTNSGTINTLTNTAGTFTNNSGGEVTGTTTITGGMVTNNATFGAVTVGAGGTFTNNTGATAGAVTNSGTTSSAGTFVSLSNNAGTFTNNSGGKVTGFTTVSGGTVTNNATLGAVTIASGAIFTNNTGATAAAVTNSGTASSAGTLASLTNNAGTFTNNAGGTVTGTTTIAGGTVTNNAAFGAVTTSSSAVFTNNTGATAGAVTNSGTASSAGTLGSVTNNAGTFTNNSGGVVTGTTTIAGGAVTNNATFGAVEVGAGATFTNNSGATAGAVTSAGTASNAGSFASLTATGGTFTNSGTISGSAAISNASFYNNSSVSGGITLFAGGLLSGIGSAGSLIANSGSTVSIAGGGTGTMNIAGDVTFNSGSTLQVNADAGGNIDQLVAGGNVTINGGTLQVSAGSGSYTAFTNYSLITASGTLSGAFESVTTDMAFLLPVVSFSGSGLTLELLRNDVKFLDVADTPNRRALAGAIDAAGGSGPIYTAIVPLATDGANEAFSQLGGEAHASFKSLFLENSHFLRDSVMDRMTGDIPSGRQSGEAGFWISGFAARTDIAGDGNAARINGGVSGVTAGVDAAVFDDWRLGIAGGYSRTESETLAGSVRAEADSYHVGVYAGGSLGMFELNAGSFYSSNDISTRRDVKIGTFSDRLEGDYRSELIQTFADISFRMKAGDAEFQPFANVAYINLHTDGFSERGGAAALSGSGSRDDVTFATLGVRWKTELEFEEMPVTLDGMFAWRHAAGDLTPASSFSLAGQAYAVEGTSIARDAALIKAGISVPLSELVRLSLSYSGEFSGRLTSNTAKFGISGRF